MANVKEYTELQIYNQPSTSNDQLILQNSATAISQADESFKSVHNTNAQEVGNKNF